MRRGIVCLTGERHRMRSEKSEDRNYFLDILKGICILFVIITHFGWEAEERLRYGFPFWIDMAVPVFMIISGYVYALSYRRKGVDSFEKAYKLSIILGNAVRYTVPFLMVCSVELCFKMKFGGGTAGSIIRWILNGGSGPGSYYYPIMIQYILIYPIIYFSIKRKGYKGLAFCSFINLAYEIMQNLYGMGETCYRMLIFRYILAISFGCFLGLHSEKIKQIWYILSLAVGSLFILSVEYWGYSPRIVIYWTRTSMFAILYTAPIFYWGLSKLQEIRCQMLEIIGKASFHIFLVQMVYYAYANAFVQRLEIKRLVHLGVNLILCIGVGILFYYIEMPIGKWLKMKVEIISGQLDKINLDGLFLKKD